MRAGKMKTLWHVVGKWATVKGRKPATPLNPYGALGRVIGTIGSLIDKKTPLTKVVQHLSMVGVDRLLACAEPVDRHTHGDQCKPPTAFHGYWLDRLWPPLTPALSQRIAVAICTSGSNRMSLSHGITWLHRWCDDLLSVPLIHMKCQPNGQANIFWGER